jgi:iron complex outermembrane receptor protein
MGERAVAVGLAVALSPLTGVPTTGTASEGSMEFEKMIIYGEAEEQPLNTTTLSEVELRQKQAQTSDTASLFKGIPGVSLYTGGGVSSLPAIHGMADDRVKVLVNGMNITSACSNHMNPALSYLAPSAVGKASVMAGITPVSQGGDSIGGTISVDPAAPIFAAAGQMSFAGRAMGLFRGNSNTFGNTLSGFAASEDFSFDYNASWAKAANYQAGNGGPTVVPTRYLSSNLYLRTAAKLRDGFVAADVALQHIPYQGFPNQRMDVAENDAMLGGLTLENVYDWGRLDGRIYYHSTWHFMDTLAERQTAPMPMKADGSDLGYRLRATIPFNDNHSFRLGSEFFRQTLMDWWPGQPVFQPFDFISINDGERSRLGTFAEWEANWNERWTTLLGARNDMVWMNAGRVHGYNDDPFDTYRFWAERFNARDRARVNANFDFTALARFNPDAYSRYEIGLARKQRAPNLYERYAWWANNPMITWFGDGNSYQGNLDLKPETAYNASFTAAWGDPERRIWRVSLTPYYTRVYDYIWGQEQNLFRSGFRGMQFVNIDYADLYGGDLSAYYAFLPESSFGSFAVRATAAYVRGVGKDGGRGRPCPYVGTQLAPICTIQNWPVEGLQAPDKVNLYHMMPLHGTLSLQHRLDTRWGGFDSAIGVDLVDRKTAVATTYGEPVTPGYVLFHVRTSYQYQKFRLDLGADNLLDKLYDHPLGGVDIIANIAKGSAPLLPLPAIGRSVYVTLNLEF